MKHTWIVKGIIKVRHELPEVQAAFNDTNVLHGIAVQVSAKQKIAGVWTPWAVWENTSTNVNGGFEVKNEKNNNQRRFKIEVKFKSDNLKIFGAHSTLIRTALGTLIGVLSNAPLTIAVFMQILKLVSRILYKTEWHTIYEEGDNISHEPGTINLPVSGELIFETGGRHALGEDEPRKHAQIWFVYTKVFSFLNELGQAIPETKPVAIKYPHHNPLFDLNLPLGDITVSNTLEASYTDPVNQIIYIVENNDHTEFLLDVLVHELMHIWMFRRTKGEYSLAWQNTVHGGVHHTPEKNSYVSFHEGLAEWLSNLAEREVFKIAEPSIYNIVGDKGVPLSRNGLKNLQLNSAAETSNNEFAWLSLFNMMITPNLHRFDFNTTEGFVTDTIKPPKLSECSSPFIPARDILRVISANEQRGYDEPITKDEMNIDSFLKRAADFIPAMTDEHIDIYKKLLDPNETVNPSQLLCKSKLVLPVTHV